MEQSTFLQRFLENEQDIVGSPIQFPQVLIVEHMFNEVVEFINALKSRCEKLIVIPKRSSLRYHPSIGEQIVENGIDLRNLGRDYFKNKTRTMEFLEREFGNKPFMLFDHGGYFSYFISEIASKFPNFKGCVEHTENGHIRYEKALRNLNRKFFAASVARDPIKQTENDDVARSIVTYTFEILKSTMNIDPSVLTNIGVIGYGRLGRVIATSLKERSLLTNITEINTTASAMAISQGHQIVPLEELVAACPLIFSATGAGALQKEHFDSIAQTTHIATVTGADDELRLPHHVKKGTLRLVGNEHQTLTRYRTINNKDVYLVLGGDPANYYSASNTREWTTGAVQATTLALASCCLSTPNITRKKILSLHDATMFQKTYDKLIACLTTYCAEKE
jgi:adenosylhomocysteinase